MSKTTPFHILLEDEHFVAINKPSGMLVHRTNISEDTCFILQLLRDQINQHIYPVHRLDRGTSGVLIFGKTSAAASYFSEQLRNKQIKKKYLAIIRGYVEAEGTIDYPLVNSRGTTKQDAVTHFSKLGETEIFEAISRYPTARYSLVEASPETGRWHQIRRHFSHLRHPIIGDKKHGDVKHNKYFHTNLGIPRMLLHASHLSFKHPEQEKETHIFAPLKPGFEKAIQILGF